jgi:hypothetical protein
MIISITGKIGSGKDTVARIWNELYPMQQWENKKWAGKLKDVASLITGIPKEKFEDQEFKHTNLGLEWATWYPNIDRPDLMSVRDLLQRLGTEAMRDGLHKNVWVNALLADYKQYKTYNGNGDEIYRYPNWIISDTRFPNELLAVREKGGIIIKVVRNNTTNHGAEHISETALDDVTGWDFIIDNNGSIEDLKDKINKINLEIRNNFINFM